MTSPNTHPSPVLIVGSMAFDDLELPSGAHENVVGGSATYASLSTTLFAPARIVAVVGADFPEATLEALSTRGVDVSGVERASGRTFRWAGRYSENLASRTTLDTQLNVFGDFRPVLPSEYRDSEFVLLGNIHPALQLEVLEQIERPRLVAADTMNFWIEGERPALERLLARIDTLVINDEELRQLAGDHNVRRAAASVLGMGPKRLVVKRGEYGALLFDEHGVFFAPAYPLEVEIDPTGAGDTFAGALMGYLAAEGNLARSTLRRALMTAAAVASFCVEDVGTRRLTTLESSAIGGRLDELRTLVAFG
ncbi:MAG: PfkB family carbohydrate kinase [Sorangiineae bacterium]|nr:PfkB family carbohydrate kinase [Polyangiaceae bacterium]MEB2322289.1 PfkB family carbohydrate kinase [Sorangiineae bacterium]